MGTQLYTIHIYIYICICIYASIQYIQATTTDRGNWGKRGEIGNRIMQNITYRVALRFVILIRYYLGDQIKSEMGGSCGNCGFV